MREVDQNIGEFILDDVNFFAPSQASVHPHFTQEGFCMNNAKSQAQIKGKNTELKLYAHLFLLKKKSPGLL